MAANTQQGVSTDVTLLTIQGVVAMLFGFAAVFWPGLTIVTFVYLFGAFVLISGLVGLVSSLMNLYDTSRSALARILLGLLAVVQIGVAVYLLRHPLLTGTTLILIVGLLFIFHGVMSVVAGLFDGKEDGGSRVLNIVIGALAVIAGVVTLMYPVSSGVAFVWVLGLYGLLTGPLLIALAHSAKSELRAAKR